MLKEEFRMHTSYSSRWMFLTFPVLVVLFSFGIAVTSKQIFQSTSLREMLLLMHISIFIYGLSVGAFGFLGNQYQERAMGYRNYLVTQPSLLPISFKKTFFGMYLRDGVFYVLLLLMPMAIGLFASIPLTGFRPLSITALFAAAILTFFIGMSLSFFVSTMYIRSRPAFGIACIAVAAMFAAGTIVSWLPLDMILPGLGFEYSLPPLVQSPGFAAIPYAVTSVLLIILLTAGAVLLVEERFEAKHVTTKDELVRNIKRFSFSPQYGVLLAKEVVDLKRSGLATRVVFTYVIPLLFLAFTAWFVRYGLAIPVGFNTVFYGAMVGFFGVTFYGWLNNIDHTDYLATLPLSVPVVIKTKLLAFAILTTWISAIFLIAIALVNNDVRLLWLALPVMIVVSIYMVVMTAYLTGLRTNSFFFDPGVLVKFTVLSMFPDLGLTILSFTIDRDVVFAMAGIGLVLGALGISALLFYRGLDKKWGRTEFGD
jgi:MFS family permease